MTSEPSEEQLVEAVFAFVKDGVYPDDEQVVSADFPASASDSLCQLLDQARTDVKTSIRELSRIAAPTVDGWIILAKGLQQDINASERQADEIEALAAEGEQLRKAYEDAAAKTRLLSNELLFNDELANALERIQELQQCISDADSALQEQDLAKTVALLNQCDEKIKASGCDNTRAIELERARTSELKHNLANAASIAWEKHIKVDVETSTVTILDRQPSVMDLSSVATVLENLDLLKAKIIGFRKVLESVILLPRLRTHGQGATTSVKIQNTHLSVGDALIDHSITKLFDDIEAILMYLDTHLPTTVMKPLSEILIPTIASRLLSGPLAQSVPADLGGIPEFQHTVERVRQFCQVLDRKQWRGGAELFKWAQNAPNVWLARKIETSLNSIRELLKRGLGNPRSVERVETQTVTREDDIFQGTNVADDWNANWTEEDEDPEEPTTHGNGTHPGEDDEEDVSAWGLDEGEDKPRGGSEEGGDNDDDGEAWGWGDESHEAGPQKSPTKLIRPSEKASSSKQNGATRPATREITLRELYSISAVPEQVLEIIVQTVEDADTLARRSDSDSMSSAANGVYGIPSLLLALFRAIAPEFYTRHTSGNMYLYNDCLYLAEQLRLYSDHMRKRVELDDTLKLDQDIPALESYGKRAYGREMDSERTIIGHLLDGAEGFTTSTEEPFAQQCDLAITSVVDRMRETHKQWKGVLSSSALLQSLGSLLATITSKMIVDIEDISDISEPESQRLTLFCQRIAELEDLFLPADNPAEPAGTPQTETHESAKPIPLTAVYCTSWLKFQYLSNILESSLVDIKYLWTEGELSLEFQPEEVVDLIEALFADSEHRRRAIAEVKRGGKR